ncbi:MAG: hypothetical protein IPH35_22605 [Rhodoferax sp.]|nr:hypothetical protein [Rhodoferax sp.]
MWSSWAFCKLVHISTDPFLPSSRYCTAVVRRFYFALGLAGLVELCTGAVAGALVRKDAPSMRMVLQPIKQGIDHRLGAQYF